ncbi:site-specific integrase [Bacillus hominis]|uniref:site-specific integrase n=1 Tax=Bacillus hominis TaxID=2817478 RepID=UPI001EE54FEB|nr:site-specific integrase [Bacillus hominis]
MRHFLVTTPKSRYRTVYILAIATGMRVGEILGLRWTDIDFNNKTISINQTLNPDNKLILDTKTSSSRRSISNDEKTIEALQKHKIKINADQLRLGQAYLNYDLVVCTKMDKLVYLGGFHDTFKA